MNKLDAFVCLIFIRIFSFFWTNAFSLKKIMYYSTLHQLRILNREIRGSML